MPCMSCGRNATRRARLALQCLVFSLCPSCLRGELIPLFSAISVVKSSCLLLRHSGRSAINEVFQAGKRALRARDQFGGERPFCSPQAQSRMAAMRASSN